MHKIAKKLLARFTKIVSPQADYALTEREKEILNLTVRLAVKMP